MGKPSKGTPKDMRLKSNKPTKSMPAAKPTMSKGDMKSSNSMVKGKMNPGCDC